MLPDAMPEGLGAPTNGRRTLGLEFELDRNQHGEALPSEAVSPNGRVLCAKQQN
jgi:hypothetical protein